MGHRTFGYFFVPGSLGDPEFVPEDVFQPTDSIENFAINSCKGDQKWNFKEARYSFFGIGVDRHLAWKACFDFHHTTPPFQPIIKLYVLVGFQATAVEQR